MNRAPISHHARQVVHTTASTHALPTAVARGAYHGMHLSIAFALCSVMEDVVLAHRTIGDGRSIAARAVTHVLLGLRYRKQLIHLTDLTPHFAITALLSRAEYHAMHAECV